MKGSLIILAFFALGVSLSYFGLLGDIFTNTDYTIFVLYILLFCVGISVGTDGEILNSVKSYGWKITLVPLATIIGTLSFTALTAILLPNRPINDWLAVSSGFGYYSLSSILITQIKGDELGTIALLSNIIREIVTLLFAPFMALYFGKLAPICSGGATTMDTTLPIIIKTSGKEFVVIAIFHGFIVDFSVPFLVSFFTSL